MNRIYRLVFNCTLRVWQVASELVRSKGGMTAPGQGVVAATVPKLRFAMWLSFGWVMLALPVAAQNAAVQGTGRIITDPDAPGKHRPTVLQAPNGVPLVNIAAPSAKGVSRNAYRQFDVGTEGAILNNSRTAVQTELGGRVQGNPWLAGGTARIILNEVNSTAPSHLHGYVEVAGDRAQVIIANPAGIQVDGGGFLNASRVTLTTGTPTFNGDALTGYRVEGGSIRIDGAGLDATRTDFTGLISRTMEVNAGIWAQQLQASVGANTVSADLSQTSAIAAQPAGGAPPTLALDVSALGGMYAGKITLLGTEQGVGVRNAGTIGAQAGELTVTLDGRLENTGALQSRENATIAATGGIRNAGTLSAAKELKVATPDLLDNSGGTLNAARLLVNAEALRNRGGSIEQTGLQSLAITAGDVRNREGGRIGIAEADTGGSSGGGSTPGGGAPGTPGGPGDGGGTPGTGNGGTTPPPIALDPGAMRVAGTLDNDGGRINAGGNIDLTSAGGLDNDGGRLGVRRLDMQAGDLSNRAGSVSVSGSALINAGHIDNAAGRIEAARELALSAQSFSNQGGALVHSGTAQTALGVHGALDNSGGTLASNADALEVSAGTLINETGEIVHAGDQGLLIGADTILGRDGLITTAGATTLRAEQIDHQGGALSATELDVYADNFDNRGGTLTASGAGGARINTSERLDNSGGTIASNGNLSVRADSFVNAAGRVQHAGEGALSIAVNTLDGAGGTLASNGALALSGNALDLRGGTTQARSIGVDGGALITADGLLIASGDEALALRLSGALDNSGGTIATNGALDLVAGSAQNRGGSIQAAGTGASTLLIAGELDNSGGVVALGGGAAIAAEDVQNAGGTLQAAGDLLLNAEGALDNSEDGLIAASGDMALGADALGNTGGTIQHAGTGTLAIDARTLSGKGGTIASNGNLALRGDTLDLRDGTTQAQRIAIDAGDLTTAGGQLVATGEEALRLSLRGRLDNDDGTIVSNGALDLSAALASNRGGAIQAAGEGATSVRIAGMMDNSGGVIAASGNTRIEAGDFLNVGGAVQAGGTSTLDLSVNGLLDNSEDGLIVASGDIAIAAGTLDNTGGSIQHAGDGTLAIDAGTLSGADGVIVSNGNLTLSGGALDLRDATTQARVIAVDAGDLTTAGGALIATSEEALEIRLRGALDNQDGTIATNGALDLSAQTARNRGGTIQAAGGADTAVRVVGIFDNTAGVLATGGRTRVHAGNLLNAGGVVQVADAAELTLRVDGLLDNSDEGLIAASGEMAIEADVLDNTDGAIQHAGEGTLTIDTRVLDGARGTLASNGRLDLSGDVLNLRDGTTQAQSIAIDGGALTTAGGNLIASGTDTLSINLRGALDNNGGTIATNGALDLAGQAASNRGGAIQAAGSGATRIAVAGALDNTDGVLAAAGNTRITAGSLVNRDGALQAAGDAALELAVDGRLDNSEGLITAGGDMALSADTLVNTAGAVSHAGDGTLAIDARVIEGAGGTLAGNGALLITGETTDLRGGTTQAARIAIESGALTTASGSLIATGDDALLLNVRGALDNADGTIATNGALDLSAGSLSNRSGAIQAAGSQATLVRVAGALDNSSGLLMTGGATTLRAGDLLNTGGAIAATSNAPLVVRVDGQLVNDGGSIESNGDIDIDAQSLRNQSGIVRTQEAIAATVAGLLDNSGGTVVAGGELTIDAGALRNHDTFDAAASTPAAQRGLFGDRVEIDAATIDNTRGQINAGNGLSLSGGALTNTGGWIDGAGTVDVAVASFENADGRLIQRGSDGALSFTTTGALSNNGGLIGAEGNAVLRAQRLQNEAGTIFATRDLDIASASDIQNRAGGLLQSGGALSLSAGGTLDNSGGGVDATGAATLEVGQLVNVDGQVLAGAAGQAGAGLSLTSQGDNDNRGGTIGSRGGDLTLHAREINNSGQGLVVANRDLTLHAQRLDNTAGTVYASRNLAWENGGTTLINDAGRFGAGGVARLTAGHIQNRQDGRIQADTLWLDAPSLDNAGGEITANTLHAQLSVLGGAGRIYGAEWLNLHFNGDFTYAAGNRMEADGRFGLTVSGTFTNQGTLQSVGELHLTAGNVINDAGGTINASNASGTGVNRITADGFIENREGASLEGDTLLLTARDFVNTGDIGGNTVGIEADTLTNGRDLGQEITGRDYAEGFIGAADLLDLRIGERLSNLDGELYSGGDLLIAGRTDGSRLARLENISGRIQAGRNLEIAADTVLNERRVVLTEHRVYVGDEQYHDPDAGTRFENYVPGNLYDSFCPSNGRTYCSHFSGHTVYFDRVLEGTRVIATSAASQLAAGRDMVIDAGSVENRFSQIDAGRNLTIRGQTASDGTDPSTWSGVVNNVALSGYKIIESGGTAEVQYQRCPTGQQCFFEPSFATVELDSTIARKDVVILGSSITAGQGINIVGGDISNTVVGAGGGLSAIGPGAIGGPGSTGLGASNSAAARRLGAVETAGGELVSGGGSVDAVQIGAVAGGGRVDSVDGAQASGGAGVGGASGEHVATRALPEGLAAQVVGSAESPLPGLVPPGNGMFDVVADPNSPFLVKTAPRFVPSETVGSGYLLDQMGIAEGTHKRLGDDAYEQRLVLEQLMALTGRRSLNGQDGLGQYRALMDSASQVADELGLLLGSPLTVTQIGALDQDIVWLVEQVVDGQTVLVPVVYLSRATAERMRGDNALIAGDSMKIQSSTTVRNDGTLEANQGLWLSADTLINDGALRSGGRLDVATIGDTVNRGELIGRSVAIDAGRDVLNTGSIGAIGGSAVVIAGRDYVQSADGRLSGTADAVVAAGRDLTLQSSANVVGPHSVSRIDAGGDLALVAGRDLTLEASKLTAGNSVALQAGQDLRLEALSHTREFSGSRSSGSTTTHQVVDIRAGGDAALSAGRDAVLIGSRVDAGGALAIAAGRDVDIQAVVDERSVESRGAVRRGSYQRSEFDQTVRGAELTAGSDIAIVGGRDVTLEAAYVGSEAGGVAIGAGRDLSLIAAEEQYSFEQTTQTKKSGFLSSKRTTTYDSVDETLIVGTTISGETVDLSAGRDMALIAARVAGTGDVSLAAGRDLLIGGAQETYSAIHDTQTKKSGLFGSGGIGVTWGTRETRNTADIEERNHVGSLIGSSEGRMDIVAGGDVAIVGSDVLSRTGIGISGENVAIVAGDSTMSVEERQTMRQSGLNISLSGRVVDTAVKAYGAARRSTEVEDDRLGALHALKAAQAGMSAYGEAAAAASGEGGGGINLRIGYGASSSESTSELEQNVHTGSQIRSGGDISIVARSGDLAVVGSTIYGENVALVAANDILLRSSQDASTHTSRSESKSGEVGITIGTEAGIGVYVAAAMAKGRGDGSGLSHNETVVTAANGLTFVSGNDTTLQGAQLVGETVVGRVGGDFTLISEQDADAFDRKDTSVSGSAAIGFGGGSANISLSQSKVNSDYLSVREQTGVQAGSGGFDIEVGGHTQLDGAALASASVNNRLSTGTLGWSDIENRAEYSASSVSVSAGTSSGGGSFSPSVGLPQSGSASSTTRAGIAAGILEVRDSDASLDGLSRDVAALQQKGLNTIFDEQKVAEQMEMGHVAEDILGTYYDERTAKYEAQIRELLGQADAASEAGDVALSSQLRQQVASLRAERDGGKLSQTLVRAGVGVGLSLLTGSNTLAGNLQHGLQMVGVHGTDTAASAAMRQHGETQAIAFTCRKSSLSCSNIEPPKDQSVEGMMAWAQEHGIQITFLDQIPRDARVIATNGILNNELRGGQLAFGHAQDDAQDATVYLQHYATGGILTDLMAAAWSSFVAPATGIHSATTRAVADAMERNIDGGYDVLAHSRGTIELRNALNILQARGYKNVHSEFDVVVVGPAVTANSLVSPLRGIIGENKIGDHLRYLNHPLDFMPSILGGSFLGSNYGPFGNPADAKNYIGIVPANLWRSLRNLPSLVGSDTVHNGYVNNNENSPNRWTWDRAERHNQIRLGLWAPHPAAPDETGAAKREGEP